MCPHGSGGIAGPPPGTVKVLFTQLMKSPMSTVIA
jgi:hypothetical protein